MGKETISKNAHLVLVGVQRVEKILKMERAQTSLASAPPGWGATWTERGCGELTGTRTDQRQLVVSYLRAMEVGCVECQVRYRGTCQQCQLQWCTLCQQNREECDVCGIPLMLTAGREASGAKTSTQRPAKRRRDAEGNDRQHAQVGGEFC